MAVARTCMTILASDPANPGALLLLARETGPKGEHLIGRYLALIPNDAMARYGLSRLRAKAGDATAARRLLAETLALDPQSLQALLDLKDFDHAAALAPDDAGVRFRRAVALKAEPARALAEIEVLLARHPEMTELEAKRGTFLAELGQFDAARKSFEAALAANPNHGEARYQLAECLDVAGRHDEARQQRIEVARRVGFVFESADDAPRPKLLLLCGTNRSDLALNYIFDSTRFDRIYAFPGAAENPAAYAARMPPHDLAFNAVTDPDSGAEDLAAISRLGMALINPPDRILRTRRDLVPALLKDIPNLHAPKTRRFGRAEIERATLDYPVLIRPAGLHGGEGLEKLDNRTAFDAYLAAAHYNAYFVTDYVDYRSADGQFRKYRFIFVDRQALPYHCAIMDHWKIHYFRATPTDAKKREEEAFLEDYRSVFSGPLADAVRSVAKTLDLDYGGMDCGIDRDGKLLIFEANAAMRVHLNDSAKDYPYKHRHVPKIRMAVTEMLLNRQSA